MKPLDEERGWIDDALEDLESRIAILGERLETTLAAALIWKYCAGEQEPEKKHNLLSGSFEDREAARVLLQEAGISEEDYAESVRGVPSYVSRSLYWSLLAWPKPLPISSPLASRLHSIVADAPLRDHETAEEETSRARSTSEPDLFADPLAVGHAVLRELGAGNRFFTRVVLGVVEINVRADWDTFKPFLKAMGRTYYAAVLAPREKASGREPEGPGRYWGRCAGAAYNRFKQRMKLRFLREAFGSVLPKDVEDDWGEGGRHGFPLRDSVPTRAAARVAAAVRTGARLRQAQTSFVKLEGEAEEESRLTEEPRA